MKMCGKLLLYYHHDSKTCKQMKLQILITLQIFYSLFSKSNLILTKGSGVGWGESYEKSYEII